MPRTLALVAALLIGLVGFTPAALAADSPEPGTPACDLLVSADATVADATTALITLRSNAQATEEQLALAERAREDAVATVTAALCLGPVIEEPPVEEPPAEQPPAEQPPAEQPDTVEQRVAAVRASIDALDCDGFGEQLGRIQDEQRALIGDATGAQLGALSDALNARLRVLGFCVEPVEPTTSTPAPSTTVVTPIPVDRDVTVVHTDDDDSTATATQVREVPEGSVATGSA